ncbi:MAG: sigma-70 family RNA polymerase sigma factor [Actinomycetota bacterium]
MKEATDAPDLERLYRDHGDRLWRAVLAYSGNRQIADDAVAEAFTQALRRVESLRDPMAWIWRVAFRLAAGELKHRRRNVGEPADRGYDDVEGLGDLMAALRTISPNQRGAIVLHHYIGYPVREVASILGSTPPAVRVHLSVGRKRLRALLEEDDDD